MNRKAAKDQAAKHNVHIQPGGGYYFQGWTGKVNEESSMTSVTQTSATREDEFSEWRHWMKDYLKEKKEKSEDERSHTSTTDSLPEDVAWNTHVQQAREFQKQRALGIAAAVTSSRQTKSAKMFQKRFERSEKYALISEPGDKRPPIPSHKQEIQKKENKEEEREVPNTESPKDEQSAPENVEEVGDDVADSLDAGHILLSGEPNVSDIHPSKSNLFVGPQPWHIKTEPLPPPPPVKNFNRSARGFLGSYVTSYY